MVEAELILSWQLTVIPQVSKLLKCSETCCLLTSDQAPSTPSPYCTFLKSDFKLYQGPQELIANEDLYPFWFCNASNILKVEVYTKFHTIIDRTHEYWSICLAKVSWRKECLDQVMKIKRDLTKWGSPIKERNGCGSKTGFHSIECNTLSRNWLDN